MRKVINLAILILLPIILIAIVLFMVKFLSFEERELFDESEIFI